MMASLRAVRPPRTTGLGGGGAASAAARPCGRLGACPAPAPAPPPACFLPSWRRLPPPAIPPVLLVGGGGASGERLRGSLGQPGGGLLPCRSTQGTGFYVDDPEWWEVGMPSNCVEIYDTEELERELAMAKDQLVVVDFYRPDCHACKAMHRALMKIADEWPDVVFLKVQFQAHCKLCRAIEVDVLPYFHLYSGARGRVAAFTCSLATIKRLRGAVAKFSPPICSRGRRPGYRAVEGRVGEGNNRKLTTRERIAMKRAMALAANGKGMGIPDVSATLWLRDVENRGGAGGGEEAGGEEEAAAAKESHQILS